MKVKFEVYFDTDLEDHEIEEEKLEDFLLDEDIFEADTYPVTRIESNRSDSILDNHDYHKVEFFNNDQSKIQIEVFVEKIKSCAKCHEVKIYEIIEAQMEIII